MATSVLAYLESEPDVFSTLLKLVQSANLEDALSNPDAALTLFAPTNDAFATVNAGTLAYLEDPANIDVLTAVLTYHVTGVSYCVAEEICGNPISPGLLTPSVVTTLEGSEVSVFVVGTELLDLIPGDIELPDLDLGLLPLVSVGGLGLGIEIDLGIIGAGSGSSVGEYDISTGNGIVHTLTGVLIPPDVALLADTYGTVGQDSDFADYTAILDTAGEAVRARLQDAAGTFTLVASADEGFNARPTGELPFVLSDATVAVDAANYNIADTKYTIAELKAAVAAGEYDLGDMVATVRDDILFIDEHEVIGEVETTNGIVLETAQPAWANTLGLPTQNVVEVARAQGFELFADLFDQAGLQSEVAQADGPFTVFAVSDEVLLAAVEASREDGEEDLYPEDGAGGNTVSEKLRQILLNHVGVAPLLLGDSIPFYKGTDTVNGIECGGIALSLVPGVLEVTITDFCSPQSIDTLQGGELGAVSPEGGALLPCILTTEDCLDLTLIPDPVLDEDYLVGCLIENECLDSLDTIIECVQRIPIINPNPPCGDKLDTIGIAACLADESRTPVECITDNAELNQGWLDFLGGFGECTSNPDKCGGKELYVDPADAQNQWTQIDPSFTGVSLIDLIGGLIPAGASAKNGRAQTAESFVSQINRARRMQAEAPLVDFGLVTNIPASNGVVHQVSAVMEPTSYTDPTPSGGSGTEAVSEEAYAWIALGGTVGVLVSGMAFYQRHQMKKTPLYDADGYGEDKPSMGKPLIQNTEDEPVSDARF